jgi:hypothetical protein
VRNLSKEGIFSEQVICLFKRRNMKNLEIFSFNFFSYKVVTSNSKCFVRGWKIGLEARRTSLRVYTKYFGAKIDGLWTHEEVIAAIRFYWEKNAKLWDLYATNFLLDDHETRFFAQVNTGTCGGSSFIRIRSLISITKCWEIKRLRWCESEALMCSSLKVYEDSIYCL